MKQYLDLLRRIQEEGVFKGDRTGTGTQSLFGHQMRFDLSKGFPLLTTKKLHLRSIIYELLWLLSGDTNIRYLQENNVHIWDSWADEDGELGPVYGEQWRAWPAPRGKTIDQLAKVIERIKTMPDDRRLIVSAWNPGLVEAMALPPCHCFFQFWTRELDEGTPRRALSCHLYQRSADVFLGVPFNIASYSLLTMMIAQVVEMKPGEFIHTFGDVHIYNNHRKQVSEQLSRDPRSLPNMVIDPSITDIDDFTFEHFELRNYNPHPHIKAPVAV